jgi:hypothetical protein
VASSSNRQFNVTLVAMRGDDPTIRYRASVRNRGSSSRSYMFRPMRISLPTDERWDGVTDFALNPKCPRQPIPRDALAASGGARGRRRDAGGTAGATAWSTRRRRA